MNIERTERETANHKDLINLGCNLVGKIREESVTVMKELKNASFTINEDRKWVFMVDKNFGMEMFYYPNQNGNPVVVAALNKKRRGSDMEIYRAVGKAVGCNEGKFGQGDFGSGCVYDRDNLLAEEKINPQEDVRAIRFLKPQILLEAIDILKQGKLVRNEGV